MIGTARGAGKVFLISLRADKCPSLFQAHPCPKRLLKRRLHRDNQHRTKGLSDMERASAAFRRQGVQFPKQEVLTGSNPNMLTKPDLVNLGVVSRDTAQG